MSKEGLIKDEDADVKINITLVGIGFQADAYVNGKHAGTIVRDFGGSYGKRKLNNFKLELAGKLFDAILEWRGDK